MFVISFHTIIYTQHSGVWRNSVREFGAIPFGSLAAKLTILSVFYCIPYVLLFFFKTSAPAPGTLGRCPKEPPAPHAVRAAANAAAPPFFPAHQAQKTTVLFVPV